ncbi:MAG: hypothetical protein RIC56_19155 [Pseudomonadales bacterium]
MYEHDGEILRGLNAAALSNWRSVCETPFFSDLLAEGKVVSTEEYTGEKDDHRTWAGYLRHERIPFVSYAYEWSFGMLKDAALLHLEILERSIPDGWTLKDASSYNVQWVGSRPVFIDVPSFEPYTEGQPWVGYRQFCMMFLYPLMLSAHKGVNYLPLLRGSIDGIEPRIASNILSGTTRFRKGVLGHVYLHAKMESRFSSRDLDEAKSLTEDADASGPAIQKLGRHSLAMVLGTIEGLRRTIARLQVPESRTTWGNYDSEHSYAEASFDIKKQFVEKHVQKRHRHVVWDLGCNTGTFSKLCAENSDYVVSVDGDEKAIERLYQDQKKQQGSKLLPLVMNLADSSPNQGWNGRERRAFVDRGQPELILCLALIHHIVISSNIPLDEFVGWLRDRNSEVIIELVGLRDAMTKMLLRNRVNQYEELTEANFEKVVSSCFDISDSQPLKGGHRKLYFLTPR